MIDQQLVINWILHLHSARDGYDHDQIPFTTEKTINIRSKLGQNRVKIFLLHSCTQVARSSCQQRFLETGRP